MDRGPRNLGDGSVVEANYRGCIRRDALNENIRGGAL